MNVRLHRRSSFEIRRDAATPIPGGRVLYDALFSRWGLQEYPDGIEFRPEEEVFSGLSLESSACPGVLLHPDKNYGTDFGEGAYPVRGGVFGPVTASDDGIHTQGQLMVYDAEWNALIASGEVAELSVGYTINPDPTPGTAPEGAPGGDELGLEYVLVHRDILWDHVAGVPEGNAETARVVLDAAQRSKIPQVTRRALADIAACRMDARPMYHDLGSWPRRTRKDSPMDKQKLFLSKIAALPRLDGKAIQDAWVDIYGESDDPGMKAALAALGGVSAEPAAAAPTPAPIAPVADEEHEEEETTPPTETEAEEEEEDGESKMDAKRLARFDAAVDVRADAIVRAKSVFGVSYKTRLDDGARKSTLTIQRDVVSKMDAAALAVIDAMPAEHRAGSMSFAYAQAGQRIDAKPGAELELLRTIAATRGDSQSRSDAEKALIDRADAIAKANADAQTNVHGATGS